MKDVLQCLAENVCGGERACVETVKSPFSVCLIVPLGFALKLQPVAPCLFILSSAILPNAMSEWGMGPEDLQRSLPASIALMQMCRDAYKGSWKE